MRSRTTTIGAALAGLAIAGTAAAGILTSEAPLVDGTTRGTIVYRMGAIHYEPGGWVDTTVTCNNLSPSPAGIAFEIFDDDDQPAGGVVRATVAAGASVTFATSADAQAAHAVVVQGLRPIDHGKGRVSASTTQVSCTALNRMRANDGSVKEAALELVKKVAF